MLWEMVIGAPAFRKGVKRRLPYIYEIEDRFTGKGWAVSWVNDLASAVGVPAGAATIATGLYAACVAAEKAARPEALNDIGRTLKASGWERSVRPSDVIGRLFNWTFGDRHLSWRCVGRSVSATTIFVGAGILALYLMKHSLPLDIRYDNIVRLCVEIIFAGFLADYIALWKTRYLLPLATGTTAAVGIVFADALLSWIISGGCFFVLLSLIDPLFTGFKETSIALFVPQYISQSLPGIVAIFTDQKYYPTLYPLLLFSTLFTSLWTTLVLISIATLKLMAPIHEFTGWFFDVRKHPVQSIGIVGGTFLIIGSLIWPIIVAII